MSGRLEHSRVILSSLLNIYLLVSLVFEAVEVRTLYLKNVEPVLRGLFTADVVIKAMLLLLGSERKRFHLKAPYNAYSPETTSGGIQSQLPLVTESCCAYWFSKDLDIGMISSHQILIF